ncbi:MAG: hypothetical protein HWN66_00545 [Candidatus Helarchaeota archaeon]|nr:hypothetical protein [Candidatus Helarchaeota archaeon]
MVRYKASPVKMRKLSVCANSTQRFLFRMLQNLLNLGSLFPPATFTVQATTEMDDDRDHGINDFLVIIRLDTVNNNQLSSKRGEQF